jgi:hypothetical protein
LALESKDHISTADLIAGSAVAGLRGVNYESRFRHCCDYNTKQWVEQSRLNDELSRRRTEDCFETARFEDAIRQGPGSWQGY